VPITYVVNIFEYNFLNDIMILYQGTSCMLRVDLGGYKPYWNTQYMQIWIVIKFHAELWFLHFYAEILFLKRHSWHSTKENNTVLFHKQIIFCEYVERLFNLHDKNLREFCE